MTVHAAPAGQNTGSVWTVYGTVQIDDEPRIVWLSHDGDGKEFFNITCGPAPVAHAGYRFLPSLLAAKGVNERDVHKVDGGELALDGNIAEAGHSSAAGWERFGKVDTGHGIGTVWHRETADGDEAFQVTRGAPPSNAVGYRRLDCLLSRFGLRRDDVIRPGLVISFPSP